MSIFNLTIRQLKWLLPVRSAKQKIEYFALNCVELQQIMWEKKSHLKSDR